MCPSQVDRARWTGKIYTPMMLVDWILLVQVHLEEFIMFITLEVLVANLKVTT